MAGFGQSEDEGAEQVDDAAGSTGDDEAYGNAQAADGQLPGSAELGEGLADAVGQDLVHAGGDQPGDGADGDGQHDELEEEDADVA